METVSMRVKMEGVANLVARGIIRFEYEKLLEHTYRQFLRPGDSVIDIGAHAGRHLRPLLDIIGDRGRALAFEPLPFAFKRLSQELPRRNLELFNMALSDKVGEFEFTHAEGTPEESGLLQRTYNDPAAARPKKIKVLVDKLDRFTKGLGSLEYIKIDIEGAEVDCLRGATETLSRFRPIVSVEYGSLAFKAYGHRAETLYDLATSSGYVLFDIFINRLESREEWVSAVDFLCWDFFMVPEEKADSFVELTTGAAAKKYFASEYIGYENNTPVLVDNVRSDVAPEQAELQIKYLTDTNIQLDIERRRLLDELDAIKASTSWRVTSPIRKVLTSLRR